MALAVTDVQGTKLYLVATGTAVATAANCVTAISGGKQIGCLQSIGDISMTRAVQQYNCISSDEVTKSAGSVSLGNQEISTLFNAADVLGQQDLIAAWDDKTRRILIIELNDQITPTTGNPTYITYEVFPSGVTIPLAKDAAVLYNATIEISSLPAIILAT
jgi:hypothetical protein